MAGAQYPFKRRALLIEHDGQGAAFLRHVALDGRRLHAGLLQDVAKGMLELRNEDVERGEEIAAEEARKSCRDEIHPIERRRRESLRR